MVVLKVLVGVEKVCLEKALIVRRRRLERSS